MPLNPEGMSLSPCILIISPFQGSKIRFANKATIISPLRGFFSSIQISFLQNLTALPEGFIIITLRYSHPSLDKEYQHQLCQILSSHVRSCRTTHQNKYQQILDLPTI